jgi:hypothetical protein
MEAINRSAVTVLPSQTFLEWLRSVDAGSADLTLEQLRLDPSIYLIPEYDTEAEAVEMLREVVSDIFEEQLTAWYDDRSAWPVRRDMAAFVNGFDFSFHSMILDLGWGAIQHEDL